MKILYENQIVSGTTAITPSSENANHPFSTAFYDERMSRFGRFLGKSSENIVFYNSGGFDFDDVLLAANNMTSSATVTFQAHASDSWGAPSVSQVLTRQTNGYYYYNWSSTQSYDYCRLVVSDTTVTDAYIKISKLFIGDSITLPGIDPAADMPNISKSVVNQNDSGQVYTDRRGKLKAATVVFPTITEAQRQELITFDEVVDIVQPFYLLVFENDLDVIAPLYCRLLKPFSYKKLKYLEWTAEFSFMENK